MNIQWVCPICKARFPETAEAEVVPCRGVTFAPLAAHLWAGGPTSEFLIQCLLECTDRDRMSLRRSDSGYMFRCVMGATTYTTWGATPVEAILKCGTLD